MTARRNEERKSEDLGTVLDHALRSTAKVEQTDMMLGRYVLTSSAVVFFILGATAMFAPDEVAQSAGQEPTSGLSVALQLAASGFLAIAILNWMSRNNRIGGIYARPLAVSNLLLCFSAALSLGKAVISGGLPTTGIGPCVVLGVLAAAFAWLAFAHDPASAHRNRWSD